MDGIWNVVPQPTLDVFTRMLYVRIWPCMTSFSWGEGFVFWISLRHMTQSHMCSSINTLLTQDSSPPHTVLVLHAALHNL